MTTHQAMLKCPWQWREPFLDEKRASRKRKVGDGGFYDPVDPSFVDHLLPGYAKKFCPDPLESDERESIEREIERLTKKKQDDEADDTMLFYDALFMKADDPFALTAVDDEPVSVGSPSRENMALVDSILQMSKTVEKLESAVDAYSDLESLSSSDDDTPSPKKPAATAPVTTVASVEQTDDRFGHHQPPFERSSLLELLSDNLQDNIFASEEGSDLLNFSTSTTAVSSTSANSRERRSSV
ncbi:TPA: hypothetical protein N0F65_012190 [Lagenidium giganteum]|uniref:Uncharacterized protein n=1 Tax=Lagenidium giganteum TaxID=4803 RepID=A0AAV2ZHP0_9STRA|nr:TPA: hypothetical protein N0F65_012190 [Lagenidium giganteum]